MAISKQCHTEILFSFTGFYSENAYDYREHCLSMHIGHFPVAFDVKQKINKQRCLIIFCPEEGCNYVTFWVKAIKQHLQGHGRDFDTIATQLKHPTTRMWRQEIIADSVDDADEEEKLSTQSRVSKILRQDATVAGAIAEINAQRELLRAQIREF